MTYQSSDSMTDTAVILAPDDSGLAPLFGVPPIRRLVLILEGAGFKFFHVIGQVQPIIPLLGDLVPPTNFHAVNDPLLLENFTGKIFPAVDKPVVILKSNLVIDRDSFGRFMRADHGSVPRLMEPRTARGQGLYLVDPAEVGSGLRALWLEDESLSDLAGRSYKVHGTERFPFLVGRDGSGTRVAEGELVSGLSSQTADRDSFLSRHFDRPISRFVSRRLARTAITPNQITLIGVTLGLLAAFLFSRTGYWAPLAGAVLFLVCITVDGIDGEVARLKLMETRFGHYLDVVTDNVVHFAIFAGIAFGLFRASGDPLYLHALWVLMGGFTLCIFAVYQCILKRSPAELERSPRTVRLLALLTNRDFAYILLLLAVIHRLDWFLLGAAAGTYVFAAILWMMRWMETRHA